MQTTISVEQDGKMVSWSDKLKGDIKQEYQAHSEDIPSESIQSNTESSPSENTSNTTSNF
jgi:hypothetical protein